MKTQLDPPENWQDFEALCRGLWSRLWQDPGTQMHGGRGQPQHGVDVFGRPDGGGEWAGVQCKLLRRAGGRLTRGQIEAEVEKARGFNPSLSSFTIATTATRDQQVQEAAREITEAQLAAGSFPVTVASWDEIAQDLERFPDLKEQLYGPATSPGPAAREAYLRALWGKLLPLQLVGVGGSSKDIPLSAVYTALDVTARIQAGGEEAEELVRAHEGAPGTGLKGEAWYLEQLRVRLEAEAAAARETQREPRREAPYSRRCTALEAAAAAPRLVLLGPPGSGKSSFARYLALSLAGEILGRGQANVERLNDPGEGTPALEAPAVPWPHGALLPLFVELKKLERSEAFQGSGEVGAEALIAYLSGEDSELARALGAAMAGRGALVILDGLDETPSRPASRARIKALIAALVRGYPKSRVMVTSRPYAYAEGSPWRLEGLGFEEASLAPLEETQSKAFISAWYAYLAGRGQCDADQAERRSADLWREIAAARYLRPLAERPLMLTMMTDLHASGGGRLRGGRAGIYEESVELLLDRWNEVRDVSVGTAVEQLGMDVDQIRRALERLAFEVHRERGAPSAEEAAEISDHEVWKALDRERSRQRVVDERRVMDYLHQRSGILLAESR